ncbi:tachykinin-like peptides receptor 86C isoform X5 [Aphis gossypii]|uniref:tachykinin-like peptides receptor 86C isoform X5 n=1 Tax=Aphis gossypii TaxID=80765 RepID=UPI0021595C46|nr:tachykinin-like peptides receptor 86C isoform X5 [Aphis gossypii]
MEGHIDDNILSNCTAMVLSLEFDKSSKELEYYNSTSLLAILGNMLKSSDLTMSKRTIAKDRLHDCVYPLPEPAHNISLWHKLIWSTVFIAMLIVAIVGNSIVIWIVAAHRRMRTVTNCYMVSLSISDLFMASLNCLPNFIYMLNSDWAFGLELCMVSNFVAYWTVASSVFTLVAITLNRYNILFLCVTYIIPLTVMAVCYTIMGRELWGSKTIGQMTQRHVESIKSKRKVVRMFAVVVTIFLICWLPYHSYFVYAYHNKSIVVKTYVQDLFLSFYWLAMSNSMVNPIIYYWMNPRFRAYFKLIICYCGGLRNPDKDSINLNVIRMNGESQYYLTRSKSGPVSLGVQHLRRPPETQVLCLPRGYSEVVRHPPKTRNNQETTVIQSSRLQKLQKTRKLSSQKLIYNQ